MTYKKTINQIVETLKADYKPEKIVLFGSCAWGKVTRNSDIDMLIVKDTAAPYGERWLEVGRLTRGLNKTIPFEPIILTPQELKCELNRNLFLQEVLGKGKVLYEKN